MKEEQKHEIALMRYAAIAPLVAGAGDAYRNNSEFYREVSEKGVAGPDGRLRHYSPATVKSWHGLYRKHGFDGLMPKGRSDLGKPRSLDADLQERIRHLKSSYPRMSAAAIHRQLADSGAVAEGEVSESTVCRYVNRLKSEMRQPAGKEMRRYEREHVNEVWCGDTSVGPRIRAESGKREKTYIIAIIDDASRFVTGCGIFFNDSFANLMSVMKSAVAKYGRTKVWNFDNGAPYRNRQMDLLAARIGTTLNYCQPYTPTSKSKIERWFRTMKDQWMAAIDPRGFASIAGLGESLLAYVDSYNRSPHSSLGGASPMDRFFSEPEHIRRLSDEEVETAFLLEIERRVSADGVVAIDGAEYEVDCRFARQRVKLRYSADMRTIFVAEGGGGTAAVRPLNKHENAVARREKVRLCGGGEGE
jgi:transposase InsO family protein